MQTPRLNHAQMTAHIARGMMLYAQMLNQPANQVAGSKAESVWRAWRAGTNEACAAFVVGQSHDLADRTMTAMQTGKIA